MIIFATGLVALITTYLIRNKRYRLLYILCKTLPRDLRGFYRFFRLFLNVFLRAKRGESVPIIFNKLARKHPHKVAYYYENQTWTYKQLDEFSNQIAHYFKSQGYTKGDTVALLLENRPEYVGIWLGLAKIGVVTALINTNLVLDPLTHSLTSVTIKALIYGNTFAKAVSDVKDKIMHLKLFEYGYGDATVLNASDLKSEMKKQPRTVPDEIADTKAIDKLIYIYTSGTTGMPKAAVIPNSRYMLAAGAVYYLTDLSPDDIFYNPLPLYHSVGGMLSAGQALIYGIPVVLKKKFSASQFWSDCQRHNCTVANYIGEVCRYLLTAQKQGNKIEHGVIKMVGNGLRPQIWEEFKDTFNIKYIYEFYGSTEGNSQMVNIDGKVGAVGFAPRLASSIFTSVLIRCDEDTGKPIRNRNGLCIRCKHNEAGLLVAKINQAQLHKAFVGYADKESTQNKLLTDVFVKGDAYFNTGDILVQDELGYFYFRDRTGDTYRWKGENVATCEVEAVISGLLDYRDVIAYGVKVPGAEGKAGMATIIDPEKTVNFKKLATQLKSNLPSYAIPMFLRTIDSVPITGTFKLKKVDLQRDGFDIDKIENTDSLYFYNGTTGEYVPLTREVFKEITIGRSL